MVFGVWVQKRSDLVGHLEASCGCLGAVLGPSWGIFGPSWAFLGPRWGLLGPSWGHLGAILGPSWAHVGATLGHLGAILGPFWAFLGLLCLYFTPPISIRSLKKTCVSSRRNASFWNPPTLAVSRATFGASLGPSWAILEPSRAIGFEEEEVRFVSSLFSELKRKKYDLFPLFFKL